MKFADSDLKRLTGKEKYLRGWEDAIWFVNTKVGAHQAAREIVPLMEAHLLKLEEAGDEFAEGF